MQVISFLMLCVWFVPFTLIISLSAGENVLPTMSSESPSMGGESINRGSKNKRQGMIKAVVDSVTGAIGNAWNMASGVRDTHSDLLT